ncbi:MAG: FHA domain-containing protein [Candidatus Jordarchaeales archaeon]
MHRFYPFSHEIHYLLRFYSNSLIFVIGRHTEDDIRINDIRVSRRHARLTLQADGRFELINQTADRAEANPITVNGALKERAVIGDGDRVSLNGVEFTLRVPVRAAA